jgi:ABC-type uncharacterized transport system involved in gliding motility auxiliary subunit
MTKKKTTQVAPTKTRTSRIVGLKRFVSKLSHPALILLVIALIVAANIMSRLVTARIDLSRGQAYTLTDSSKKIVSAISGEPVKMTFYQSSTLPSQLQPVARDVRDLLTEYDRAGNVQVSYIDPVSTEDQQAAEAAGIVPLQFSLTKRDQLEYSKGYFGIVIARGKDSQVVSQAIQLGDLEYQISSAIYKLTTKELPTVGLVGDEGVDPAQLEPLRQLLSSQFTVQSSSTPEASTKALLVVDSGAKTYEEGEIAKLTSYVKGGGNAIFMLDGVTVDPTLQAAEATHGLFDLLSSFGIVLQKDLVLSQQSEFINASAQAGGQFQVIVPYYFWLKTATFNPEVSFFSNIQSISMPWASSLQLKKVNGVNTKELIQTSPVSWHQTENFTLDPQAITDPKQSELKPFVIGAQSTLEKGGSVVVIPSSRFAFAQFQSQNSGNLNLLMNMVSQFAAGGALSGIRQRDVSIVPIPTLSDNAREMVKYTTILLLPLLFVAYGALRLYKRR